MGEKKLGRIIVNLRLRLMPSQEELLKDNQCEQSGPSKLEIANKIETQIKKQTKPSNHCIQPN